MHAYNVNQGSYDYHHSEFDEFDTHTLRSKPESLDNLIKLTKFNRRELKLMYRGFKQLCPSGVVKEDKFKMIYAQFFPRGADTNGYARFVFNSFDVQRKQEITFTDFVIGLSVLTRGSLDEQLKWIFTLYDLNGDGQITRDELAKIVSSVHDLMGKYALSCQQQHLLDGSAAAIAAASGDNEPDSENNNNMKAAASQSLLAPAPAGKLTAPAGANNELGHDELTESLFRKFDLNRDGVITLDEFLEACQKDENITKSISVFNTIL